MPLTVVLAEPVAVAAEVPVPLGVPPLLPDTVGVMLAVQLPLPLPLCVAPLLRVPVALELSV